MQNEIFNSQISEPAAIAIRMVINKLIKEKICEADEFITLIDLDYKNSWQEIAEKIAEKLEKKIRSAEIHPNNVKPWQICKNYKAEFQKIAEIRAWKSAHGAINRILICVNAIFERKYY